MKIKKKRGVGEGVGSGGGSGWGGQGGCERRFEVFGKIHTKKIGGGGGGYKFHMNDHSCNILFII